MRRLLLLRLLAFCVGFSVLVGTPAAARAQDADDVEAVEEREVLEETEEKAPRTRVGAAPVAAEELGEDRPRRMRPWLKWTSLVVSCGAAGVSSCLACGVGAFLGNRNAIPGLVGLFVGTAAGVGDPVSLLLAYAVNNTIAPDCFTVPCMGLCTLLGSWPLLGLLLPVIFTEPVPVEEAGSGEN